jgi:hypothetical protein
MLAITTFMFTLSLIGLVLMTALDSQYVYADVHQTGGGIWPVTQTYIISNILVAITFIMVGSVNHGLSAANSHV